MTGEYQHSLDSKGRLFMPAKLREELGVTFCDMDQLLAEYRRTCATTQTLQRA